MLNWLVIDTYCLRKIATKNKISPSPASSAHPRAIRLSDFTNINIPINNSTVVAQLPSKESTWTSASRCTASNSCSVARMCLQSGLVICEHITSFENLIEILAAKYHEDIWSLSSHKMSLHDRLFKKMVSIQLYNMVLLAFYSLYYFYKDTFLYR